MEENKHHKTEHIKHNVDSKSAHNHAHIKNENKTTERKPVDSKKSLLIIAGIIIGIIIIIVASVVLVKYIFKNDSIVEYNHYTFTKFEGNKWMTQQLIGGQLYNIPFYYNPNEVLDIPVDPNSVNSIRYFKDHTNGTIYVSFDPNESSKVILAGVEYARILGNVYNIYNMKVKSSITKPTDNTTDYPIITCKNQSKNTFVIVQTLSDKNLVSIRDNCVTIEYLNATESIRVADAFAFRLLNMIRD
jgi:hypothetical protein